MTTSHLKSYFLASTASLAFAGTALADVTAQEVWDSWKGYAEGIGQTISVGSESYNNGTLSLDDVNMAMAFPDGKMAGTLQSLVLRELDDGTVEITMSPDYPLSFSVDPSDGETVDVAMVVRQSDLKMIASGEDGTIAYDYDAPQLNVTVDKIFVGGKEVEQTIELAMTDLGGRYEMTEGERRQIESRSQIASMTMNVDFTDPKTDDDVSITASLQNLTSTSTGMLPLVIDPNDPAWVFSDDFAATGQFQTGASGYDMSVDDGESTFVLRGDTASTTVNFDLSEGKIAYGGSAKETEYRFSGSEIPFPEVKLGMAETQFDLAIPIAQTEQPADFRFLTKVVGLYVSDEIWGMFDPGQVLPRDPATVVLDLSGKLKWLVDLTDPTTMPDDPEETPAELSAVAINEITVSAAGASIEGEGDFTFDPTDTVTFEGMPAPDGEVNFTITGAQGLIDKLIQMGLLPEDQAMGARMMLGMFARPGDGPDTLTSKIEVNPDGSILANGQRIK